MPPEVPPQAGQPTITGTTVEWPPCAVVNLVFDVQSEFVASCVENPAGGEVIVLVTEYGGTAPLLVVFVFGTPPGGLVVVEEALRELAELYRGIDIASCGSLYHG